MTQQLLTSYLSLLPSLTPEMRVSWPIEFSQVTSVTVTGWGLSADKTSVHTGWHFEYDTVADDEVRAMTVGVLRWMNIGEPALVIENDNFATRMLAEFEIAELPTLPTWWPQCAFLVYDELDWNKVRQAIQAIVRSLSPAVRQALEQGEAALLGASVDQIVRWFLGEPRNGAPVVFGPSRSGGCAGRR